MAWSDRVSPASNPRVSRTGIYEPRKSQFSRSHVSKSWWTCLCCPNIDMLCSMCGLQYLNFAHTELQIDCKMQNDPNILFPKMASIIE